MKPWIYRLVLLALAGGSQAAEAAISVSKPLQSGLNAFVGHCPRPRRTTLFDWSAFPGQGNHVPGDVGNHLRQMSFENGPVGASIRSLSGHVLDIANWVDGPGFGADPNAQADLGIDDVESFELTVTGCRQIGFGISTGQGNVDSQVDGNGARFLVEVYRRVGDTTPFLTQEFDVGPGADAVWVTVASARRFKKVIVREIGRNGVGPAISDQYFTNILGCHCAKVGEVGPPRPD